MCKLLFSFFLEDPADKDNEKDEEKDKDIHHNRRLLKPCVTFEPFDLLTKKASFSPLFYIKCIQNYPPVFCCSTTVVDGSTYAADALMLLMR